MNKDNNFVKNICIFEDSGYENLLPLTYIHPVYELLCGMSKLREKFIRIYPDAKLHLLSRDYLIPVLKKKVSAYSYNHLQTIKNEGCLFLNGRILAHPELNIDIPLQGEDEIFIHEDELIAARLTNQTVSLMKSEEWDYFQESIFKKDLSNKIFKKWINKVTTIKVEMINYLWDLIYLNSRAIQLDSLWLTPNIQGFLDPSVTIYGNEYDVFIETDAEIKANVVLDATKGPIFIGKRAIVTSYTSIEGPVFIGENSKINRGHIQSGTSIGKHCQIGGEVNSSIFHGYNNKPHVGYIGHSYIGEWVDLDALTTNSDLEGYETIKVFTKQKNIDSKKTKLGCFIGGYTKTGIGTFISPGTVIGIGCNILGGGVPKVLPSFSYGRNNDFCVYDFEKFISDNKNKINSRNTEHTEAKIQLLKTIYKMSTE